MSTEDRLRRLLHSAGPPPAVSENDWSIFAHAAHRDRRRRSLTAMVAAALVVAMAAGTWAVDRIDDQSMPPAGEPVEPVTLPDDVPRECPGAEPYEPASDLGAVAFVRDGDVYRADLQGGEVKLVETRNEYVKPDIQWSPDGRWISFGDGLLVRATGGAVCRPLGDITDPTWGADQVLTGLRKGEVFFGRPGEEAREAHVTGRVAVPPLVVSHGGRSVAFTAIDPDSRGSTEIWVLDVPLERALLSHRLPESDPFAPPEIAGWSPNGQWIFYWETRQGSFPSESGSLAAVRRTPSPARIQVGPALYGDDLTWCGNTLVLVAPDQRLVDEGRRLVTARAPSWTLQHLTNLANDIWVEPECSPRGDAIAGMTHGIYSRPSRPNSLSVITVPDGAVSYQGSWEGATEIETGPAGWSRDGNWIMVELRDQNSNGTYLRLVDYFGGGLSARRGLELVRVGPEGSNLGARAYDWYQPGN